jgi:hypothetical protein
MPRLRILDHLRGGVWIGKLPGSGLIVETSLLSFPNRSVVLRGACRSESARLRCSNTTPHSLKLSHFIQPVRLYFLEIAPTGKTAGHSVGGAPDPLVGVVLLAIYKTGKRFRTRRQVCARRLVVIVGLIFNGPVTNFQEIGVGSTFRA